MAGIYRVWHGRNPKTNHDSPVLFIQGVSSIQEASLVISSLRRYDEFLSEDKTTSGLLVSHDCGSTWKEWEDENGRDICEIMGYGR